MILRRRLPTLALALAAILVAAIVPAGCGEASSDDSEQSYPEMLSDLEQAATSNRPARFVDSARELATPAERSVLLAFCRTSLSLELNDETDLLERDAEYLDRIRHLAEYRRIDEVESFTAAMKELRKALNVVEIDPQLNGRYKKACYGG